MQHEMIHQDAKKDVSEFWQDAACGEKLLLDSVDDEGFRRQAEERYRLEPYILDFARFQDWRDRRVLEIGVGMGSDHQHFEEAGAISSGIDLTQKAIELTEDRLRLSGLTSELSVGDAESLGFSDNEFDLVYSWGVIHHSPDTLQAVREIHRVLKPGGTSLVMIYNKWSLVGLMLWFRYALLRFRPFTSLRRIYDEHLESPGTKAYSPDEARALFSQFDDVQISIVLSHGDLLSSGAGQRHQGILLSVARRVWPRWFIRRFMSGLGLFMMIEAHKQG